MREMNTATTIIMWLLVAAALLAANYRWLRVAQREHYAPGRVTAMVRIWVKARAFNIELLLLSFAVITAGVLWWWWAVLPGLALALCFPWHLPLHSSSNPLVFTGRVKRLAAALLGLEIIIAAATFSPLRAAFMVPLVFILTDLALAITKPIEARAAKKFVVEAKNKIDDVAPTVIAITGSYGKTSTKAYAAQLISGSKQTLASPASFNNKLGLSSTVNNSLAYGTEVFIAEMGTYGPGEIRELCSIFKPKIAAITTIGDAHLERMKNRATIVAAKSEIVEGVETAVLNIDVPELSALASKISNSVKVIRVSETSLDADVAVLVGESKTVDAASWDVYYGGEMITSVPAPETGHRINLAIAVGLAVAVEVTPDRIAATLTSLPTAAHRAEVARDSNGRIIIDDTYNSNPVGAGSALTSAKQLAGEKSVWTITPGMVELGQDQKFRNEEFARAATELPNHHLVIVGHTNRKALLSGAVARTRVHVVSSREAATSLVTAQTTDGDVLLYENDLPSHYP